MRAVLYCLLNFRFTSHDENSRFMAASDHRVVTHYLSCLPMAIDTYIGIEHAQKSL